MRGPTRGIAAGAMALAMVAAQPGLAQVVPPPVGGSDANPPCVLDKCLNDAPPSAPRFPTASRYNGRRPAVASGTFDFYVLSLSWSPAFCDTGGASKSPDQCAAGRNLGFVVHGLWPQNTRGYPSDCDGGSRFPSRAALDSVGDLYPDAGLARYEWRKHGTCTGLSPTDYFAAVRQARGMVTIPQSLQQPSEPQTLAPLDIARSFVAGTPGLRTDTMAVTCRQGELQEVRICLSKDLRGFVSCPEVARDACRTRAVSVLPVR